MLKNTPVFEDDADLAGEMFREVALRVVDAMGTFRNGQYAGVVERFVVVRGEIDASFNERQRHGVWHAEQCLVDGGRTDLLPPWLGNHVVERATQQTIDALDVRDHHVVAQCE